MDGRKGIHFPACDISPASYKRLPRLEELRAGVTGGSKLFDEVLKTLSGGYSVGGPSRSLADISDEELCEEVLADLHFDVEEFPAMSRACYWLWDKALSQQRAGETPNPSFADIYIKLCAQQRNDFRYVLEVFFLEEGDEDLRKEFKEKAGFPPEHFEQRHWEKIKQADEVIERARAIVLARYGQKPV